MTENPFAARLAELAAELSGYDESDMVPTRTFLELGFDSLFLTQLATAFSKEFGVKITFRQLISEFATIDRLAGHLATFASPPQAAPSAPEPIELPREPVAQSVAPAPRPVLRPASVNGPVGVGLAGVFAQQLTLMQQQLEMLGGRTATVVAPGNPVTATPATPAKAVAPDSEEPLEKPGLPAGFGPNVKRDGEGPQLTPEQRAHIDRLIARYNAKTHGSKERTQADRPHHADPRTAAGFNALWKEMVYPVVVKKSYGAHLWDIDDNQYVDLLNGFGPNFFGHRAPFITDALKAQLDSGYEIGPQTPRAGDAAKLMCELTGMDRVSWVNTGSEAVQAAIRISRTVTGRDKIVVFKGDYHGNFDEVLVRGVTAKSGARRTVPLAPGIPFQSVGNVIVLDYGEESALEAIAAEADEIAAVLVEPIQSRRPEFQPREFLHKLRRLTEEKEIVLVFDEVITGFRTCPGGAQEYFGVKADLATYGKIIGGGMPIGVVAGRARFMDTFDGGMWGYGDASAPTAGVTFFAGTFVRHPMAIAAAYASLKYLKEMGPALQEGVNRKAARLALELNEFFRERGVNFFVAQFASQMFIRNSEESELATLFFYHMRDRGIHVLEGFPSYMTAAHTDADVDRIIAAAKDSILEMQADGVLPVREGVAPAAYVRRFPLTPAQRDLWLASQMSESASCAFNESDTIIIDGLIDADKFMLAVRETLDANEAFRLRFDRDGETQHVAPASDVEVQITDLSALSPAKQEERRLAAFRQMALASFDLEKGPLAATHLFRLARDRHVFVIYCHHIVFDGYSANLTVSEISERYAAMMERKVYGQSPNAPFSVYAPTVSREMSVDNYWSDVYREGAPAPLDLPTDRPHPARRTYNGATAHHMIPAALGEALADVAKKIGVTDAALYLSAYSALLARLSTLEDIVVGLPAAGQANHGVDAVGYCVNILPLRTSPAFDTPFADFARATFVAAGHAVEHQDVSLGALVRKLAIPRDPSRLPLIESVFNFSRYFVNVTIPGCRIMARENRRYAVYHDLFMNIGQSNGDLTIDWDYASDLFDEATIDRWVGFFVTMLEDIAANPLKPIGELRLEDAGDDDVVVALPQR